MLDRLYGSIAFARRRWIERHPALRRHLDQPVISIGNLVVGGTGKTPIVAAVARWLVARGERPAILSRGYGRARELDGVTVVSDGAGIHATVDIAGDEPLMLARQVPGAAVCVAADRHLAGILSERALGSTVHVLDDGFQHCHLHRDLDVLVSGPGEIAGGHVLPRGRLREPMEAAARAHLLIVVGADRHAAAAEAWALGIGESAGATRVQGEVYLAETGRPVVAVAAIANPAQFFDALRAQGWSLASALAFRDHHTFTRSDIRRIADLVEESGAPFAVTTEKDAVRFEACGMLPFTLAAVPMTVVFDRWETIEGALVAALERARASRGTKSQTTADCRLPTAEGDRR